MSDLIPCPSSTGLISAAKIEMTIGDYREKISEQDRQQIAELIAIEVAISEWEEAIIWIAKGWDNIDEYDHDVYYRYTVDKLVTHYTQYHALPVHIANRLHAADERFKAVTHPSSLCVFRSEEFQNPVQYWYFYRWQSDCTFLRAVISD